MAPVSAPDQPAPDQPAHDTVLVVDFGAQYAQLIARRVREAHVFSEIVQSTISAEALAAKNPKAIIFSGGPASVNVAGAPVIDPAVYDLGVPILGICYGMQLIALQLGGEVANTGRGEYGRTLLTVTDPSTTVLEGRAVTTNVWMSHFDSVTGLPPGFVGTATTLEIANAAMADATRRIHAVQFHPEVMHTEDGQRVLERFSWAAHLGGIERHLEPEVFI